MRYTEKVHVSERLARTCTLLTACRTADVLMPSGPWEVLGMAMTG